MLGVLFCLFFSNTCFLPYRIELSFFDIMFHLYFGGTTTAGRKMGFIGEGGREKGKEVPTLAFFPYKENQQDGK